MALFQFHRVLISFAIMFDFIFTLWSIRRWNATGENINLIMAVGSSIVTVMLLAYLVYFSKNLNAMRDDMIRRANARHDGPLSQ
jgi:hypothetical protein